MTMARFTALLIFLPLAMAQSIAPSNDAIPTPTDQLILSYRAGGMSGQVVVAPLTREIGLGQSQTALNQISIQGKVWPVDAHNETNITSDDIAFISCDPNTNTSNISPSDIVGQTVLQPVRAILLYSLTDSHCNLTGSFGYYSILTMTSVKDSNMLLSVISNAGTAPDASIQDRTLTTGSSSSNPTNSPPAPTTAVAMSILYSITGIITLLFLAIIATGAVRAHRHPERYGPRRAGLPGRPRQSRAKGLARAMLETLPIVKFGDPEPDKPESRDLELEEGAGHSSTQETSTAANKNATDAAKPKDGQTVARKLPSADEEITSGLGPDIQNQPASGSREDLAAAAEALGCSICTEDFEKGEDVRVLPCNHKYHPACIDPWLLNVSGTCPLCRVDLRGDKTEAPAEGAEGPLSPPLDAPEGSAQGEASAQAGALSNLRDAPASERIAALRSLRTQQPATTETDTAELGRRAKLANRLKEKFRIRTHPVPEVRESVSAASAASRRRSSVHPDAVLAPGGLLGVSALPPPVYDSEQRNGSRS